MKDKLTDEEIKLLEQTEVDSKFKLLNDEVKDSRELLGEYVVPSEEKVQEEDVKSTRKLLKE